ncbi:MAG: hypothetical protein ACE5F3_05660 [Mariprofundaceae bacterium]
MNGYSWNLHTPEQWLGLFGAMLILGAYMITVGRPKKRCLAYSISLSGGLLLLAVALIYHNFGLIVLEIFWVAINAWGLWRVYRERKPI